MSENEEFNPSDSDNDETVANSRETNVEEVAEVIAEFEKYRERLVNETMAAAQKANYLRRWRWLKLSRNLLRLMLD